MNLAHGRRLTSVPGPSVVPDRVLQAMGRAMPNIYEGALLETSDSLFRDLPVIAGTDGRVHVAIANGHGAWEMALSNTLRRGDRVLVLESGLFAIGWGEQAGALGAEVEILPGNERAAVDPDRVESRLRADRDGRIRAILVAHVDTASGVCNDLPAIRAAIDAAGHPALFLVDAIASLGCVPFRMDAWGIDLTVGASQKGLMTPPGLGLVWAGARALAAHASADLRTPYWDWSSREQPGEHYFRYCGTPPVSLLLALREALDMLLAEGLEHAWRRHQVFARAVRAAVAAWAAPGGMEFGVLDPDRRADSTTTIRTGGIDANRLRRISEHDAGLTLGIGLGDREGSFRIGHMGHLNPPMVLGTLATVEAALHALDAPLGGAGTDAALRVLGAALAAPEPETGQA